MFLLDAAVGYEVPTVLTSCGLHLRYSTGTGDTATALEDRASNESLLEKYFVTKGKEGTLGAANKKFADRVKKSRSREVGIHYENGMGIHHAGMLRGDRKLTEQMFAEGAM